MNVWKLFDSTNYPLASSTWIYRCEKRTVFLEESYCHAIFQMIYHAVSTNIGFKDMTFFMWKTNTIFLIKVGLTHCQNPDTINKTGVSVQVQVSCMQYFCCPENLHECRTVDGLRLGHRNRWCLLPLNPQYHHTVQYLTQA